jgi:hypothetical protein
MLFQLIFPLFFSLRRFRYGCLAILGTVLTLIGGINLSQAGTLTRWEFDPKTNQAIFTLEEETTPKVFFLADPPRLVVDFPDTQVGDITMEHQYLGAVTEIRASQFTETTARVVLEFTPDTSLSPQQVELSPLPGNRWLLRPQMMSPGLNTALPLPPVQPPLAGGDVTVNVPPIPRRSLGSPARAARQTPIIQFGQPLPPGNNLAPNESLEPSEGIIKRGTTLKLRYAGEKSLYLQPEQTIQEVLLIAQAIHRSDQTVIIPVGTPVIGRFEHNEQGSYFLTQAIVLNNQNIPLRARSLKLESIFPVQPFPRGDRSPAESSSLPTSSRVVIDPNAVVPVTLAEDWQY